MFGNIFRALNNALVDDEEEEGDVGPCAEFQNADEVTRARELLGTMTTASETSDEQLRSMAELAEILGLAESKYVEEMASSGQADPYINGREQHLIGALLHLVFVATEPIYELFKEHILQMQLSTQNKVQLSRNSVTAARLLLAGCDGCVCHLLSRSQKQILEFLREQRVVEALVCCMKSEEECGLAVAARLCCTGIVAAAVNYADALNCLSDLHIATPLLQRLHTTVEQFETIKHQYDQSFEELGAPNAAAPLVGELRYILSCLSTMVDFPDFPEVAVLEKEVLATLIVLLGDDVRFQHGVEGVLHETLQFLNSLLRHKKFAYVFVERGGLMLMLKVCSQKPRIGRDLAFCISNVSQFTGVMEKICLVPAAAESLMATSLWLMSLERQDCTLRETAYFLIVA
eukprot:SAG11_NODE_4878_length_1737_cov_1.667888_1_plen_402_part_01